MGCAHASVDMLGWRDQRTYTYVALGQLGTSKKPILFRHLRTTQKHFTHLLYIATQYTLVRNQPAPLRLRRRATPHGRKTHQCR